MRRDDIRQCTRERNDVLHDGDGSRIGAQNTGNDDAIDHSEQSQEPEWLKARPSKWFKAGFRNRAVVLLVVHT